VSTGTLAGAARRVDGQQWSINRCVSMPLTKNVAAPACSIACAISL
jgi:hypothetical protein